jgi:hypothetical protein
MQPILPFWFPLRQGKAEPVGEDCYRLTAPNLPPAFIQIRQAENSRWAASVRLGQDGPDLASTAPEFSTQNEAWAAAFELYRQQLVI